MATIITGRSLTISIDSDDYSAQCGAVSLNPTNNTEIFQTLAGPAAKNLSTSWELQLTGWQDWNESSGLGPALWTAAEAGTAVAFSLEVDAGAAFTGNIIPVFPSVGGDAASALEIDITFPVDGDVTFTPGA